MHTLLYSYQSILTSQAHLDLTLNFNPMRAIATYAQKMKVKGHSVQKIRVETNKQMDTTEDTYHSGYVVKHVTVRSSG